MTTRVGISENSGLVHGVLNINMRVNFVKDAMVTSILVNSLVSNRRYAPLLVLRSSLSLICFLSSIFLGISTLIVNDTFRRITSACIPENSGPFGLRRGIAPIATPSRSISMKCLSIVPLTWFQHLTCTPTEVSWVLGVLYYISYSNYYFSGILQLTNRIRLAEGVHREVVSDFNFMVG